MRDTGTRTNRRKWNKRKGTLRRIVEAEAGKEAVGKGKLRPKRGGRAEEERVNSENPAKIIESLPGHGPSIFSFDAAYLCLVTTNQTTP